MSYDFSTVDLSKIDMTEDEVLTQSLIKKPDLHGPEIVRNLRSDGKDDNIVSSKIYSYGSTFSSYNSTLVGYTMTTSVPDYTDAIEQTSASTFLQSIMMTDSDFRRISEVRRYSVAYSWNDNDVTDIIQYYLSTNPWKTYYGSDKDDAVCSILRRESVNERNIKIDDYVETGIRSKIGYSEEFEAKKQQAVLKSLSERIENSFDDSDLFSMNSVYETLMWYRELLSSEEKIKYDTRRGLFNWEASRQRDKQDEFRTSFYRRPTTGRFDRIEYDYDMEQVALRLAGLL